MGRGIDSVGIRITCGDLRVKLGVSEVTDDSRVTDR
jgi:hypothetical protein